MEFTTEQIIGAINDVLGQNKIDLNNVISLSLFVSNVGKKLIGTLNNVYLTAVQRIDIIADIGAQITAYLEEKTLITFELAQQFRDVLKNTDEFKQLIQAINNFALAEPEEKKTILHSFICGCINSILGPDKSKV